MSCDSTERIEQFLKDTKQVSEEQYEMVVALRKIINTANPDATEEIKYGGLVFNVGKDLITGIFTRKNHISLEFSYGAGFEDSDGHLEGTGKLRRHIKIHEMEDISKKEVESFVKISFE